MMPLNVIVIRITGNKYWQPKNGFKLLLSNLYVKIMKRQNDLYKMALNLDQFIVFILEIEDTIMNFLRTKKLIVLLALCNAQ